MSDDATYLEEISELFISESETLEYSISSLSQYSKTLSPDEIVALYHRIMNVASLMQTLMKKISDDDYEKNQRLFERLKSTEALIGDSFNLRLHPSILSQLNSTIEESMNALKSNKTKDRTKQAIEEESRNYEKLRQIMSTKEFVEQYDKMIKND